MKEEKKENAAGKTYEIEFAGQKRKMGLDELIEFAQACASRLDAANGDLPDLQAFMEQYPDVTEIPDEVAQAMRGGEKMLDAYRKYENAKLKEELGAAQKNALNRKQAIGSMRGDGAEEDELAELMRVFESVFK